MANGLHSIVSLPVASQTQFPSVLIPPRYQCIREKCRSEFFGKGGRNAMLFVSSLPVTKLGNCREHGRERILIHPIRASNEGPAPSDLNATMKEGEKTNESAGGSNKDVSGAGVSWVAPSWLTSLIKSLRAPDTSGIPIADAKLEDVGDLLGGALFLPLFKWMLESGPVYRLAAGPRDFVIVSSPEAAKHVLRGTGSVYEKGLVKEVSEFLFGNGFAIAEGEVWTARRRAVSPALHRRYLEAMVDGVFARCSSRLIETLEKYEQEEPLSLKSPTNEQKKVNMEERFSQLTLDVIGLSVFNFDFDSLNRDSEVIQAVYTALKETESRATDILPYWQIPLLCALDPRQRKAYSAVALIRSTVDSLVQKCKEMIEREERERGGRETGETEEDYLNESDPSVLRFLLASREEVSSSQLRDDLLSMLVAGHETTGSVLTWTLYLLVQNPDQLARAYAEVDSVLSSSSSPSPSFSQTRQLPFLMRTINESMRLYPHPPVLIRRALSDDVLPGGYSIKRGQDVMISVYNVHHSPAVWDDPESFSPDRFLSFSPSAPPNEANTDFRYVPFSGGPRKCVGDQFALLEAQVALATLLRRFEFSLVPDQEIGMTTGATIHTKNGLYMYVSPRAASSFLQQPITVLTSISST